MIVEELSKELEEREIKSFEEAIDFKYLFQGKLVELWLNHKISTEKFLEQLTKMYEKILDELSKAMLDYEKICIIGFGKLGAGEINFSSDLDICFIISSQSDEEKITKDVRKFVNITSQRKGERFLWRLDLDLRPGGKSSPIVITDKFFTWYYLNLGKTDDRYALLRARPVAGNKKLGEEVLKEIEPFVFRKYLDFSAIERLKEIKVSISRHLRRDEKIFDVKYSEGGIREVEFVVFANQLIFGGKDERLREKKTTKILELLKQYIKDETYPSLKDCYIFLREIESLIQLDEEQRFTIEQKDIPKITQFYRISEQEFFERLKLVRNKVHKIFEETFEVEVPEYKIITEDDTQDDIRNYLYELGYEDVQSALQIINSLREKTLFLKEKKRISVADFGAKTFEIKTEELTVSEKLISSIVWYSAKSPDKNSSLSFFHSLIKSIGKRRGFYFLLMKNEKLIEILAKLSGISRLFANYLINHPESLDIIFLSYKHSPEPPDEDDFWEKVKNEDEEEVMNEIRREKKEKTLILLLEDLSKNIEFAKVSKRICKIYDFVVRETVSLTAREKLKINLPPSKLSIPFFIVALGKYGSEEAIYGSDTDLLFIFSEGSQEEWIRFAQKFIVFLTSKTKEGSGIEVDMRLRPSGHAGPLAISTKSLEEFYIKSANIWQKIPILKSRVIFPKESKAIEQEIQKIKQMAFENIEISELKSSFKELKRKSSEKLSLKFVDGKKIINLKYIEGGLQDIELISHFIQIREKKFDISFVDSIKLAEEVLGENLRKPYEILRKIEKYIKIKSDFPLEDIWIDPEDRNFWEEITKVEKISKDEFESALKKVRDIFSKVIGY
jgi:glutamate-ammonia-ligase adenylyltransferase